MFTHRGSDVPKKLGDTTPLHELTLYDLMEPSPTKEQNLDTSDNAGGVIHDMDLTSMEKNRPTVSTSEVLNTPVQKKAPTVRILENKRIPAPMGAALKSMLGGPVRVLSNPTKTAHTTEIKILNKLPGKPISTFGNAPVKIGSTTIAAPSGSTATILPSTSPKNISGVTMTPIKTSDGKVIYLQKTVTATGGATSKLPVTGTPRLTTQTTSGSSIRQTLISKGVSLTSTAPIKTITPSTSATLRGVTTVAATKTTPQTSTNPITTLPGTSSQSAGLVKTQASVDTTPTTIASKIQVVRTSDGKVIKLNQGSAPVILNTLRTPAGTSTSKPTAILSSSGSKLISKPAAQVIIKGPLKQIPVGSSIRPVINSASPTATTLTSSTGTTAAATATTSSAGTSVPTGKMLVQSSTGKQIVVPSKNIIKLSPKPSSSGSTTITNTSATPSGLHAIQLPGKSGVQYVRVIPSTANDSTSPQKVPLGRPRTSSNNNSPTVSVGNTNKIVMKTPGGNIVPLPSMQTLVPRRAPGPTVNAKTPANSSLEAGRKHRLSDMNVQIKHLPNESGNEAGGPEAKKARYVIAMGHSSSSTTTSSSTGPAVQKNLQKVIGARAPVVQRVTVQSASTSGVNNPSRKVYNLVTKSDANGVKYMICNKSGEGKPRTVYNTTMRRGYTLAETKLRRPITLTPQQVRFKQMKQHQQRQIVAQAKQRQQQLQKQNQTTISKTQQSATTQENKSNVPAKPLFDILKPPSAPAPAATVALDALGGSRRKHCNCSKSQCLKLYCDCFANGEFCQDCTCKDCFNNLDYEVKRERAIRSCLERNPSAFKPKITAPNSGDMRLHNKGCNCKRSGCLKNYCECYEAKIPCSTMCKCVGCRNMEDRPDVDMDSIDSLADVKLQPNKGKDVNGSLLQDNRSNVYLTDDVIEATIMCMISRIVMHEKQNLPVEDTEREVMEELGESLNQIITFAKEKNDTFHMDDSKTTA